MLRCNVCAADLGAPVYVSGKAKSLTTMNTLIDGETSVYFCDNCGHAQTNALEDLDRYYAEEYEINIDSMDADQLYDVVDGKEIYRSEHQANVLLDKVDLSKFRRVLDYGCAKAPTLHRVREKAPGIEAYLFDVTDKYVPFWEEFPEPRKYAAFSPDAAWNDEIDVVLSFYALEHIPDLTGILGNVKSLLTEGGYFYFIVPNLYRNAADFIVADHVNHFSSQSLHALLELNGFYDIDVDADAHNAAFVVSARVDKSGTRATALTPRDTSATRAAAEELAAFWGGVKDRICAFEAALREDKPRAIYGAGIYGNFIYACLEEPEKITNFIDMNKFLAGKTVHGVSVVPPASFAPDTAAIFAGLNPLAARRIISSVEAFEQKSLEVFYLD